MEKQIKEMNEKLNQAFNQIKCMQNIVFLGDYNPLKFLLSNNFRTIKEISGACNGFYLNSKVTFDSGLKEYSFKVDSTGNIMVGFAVANLVKEAGFSTKKDSWVINLSNGYLFVCGVGSQVFIATEVAAPNGSIVSICLDTKDLQFFLKINGKETTTKHKLVLTDIQKNNLYPCIDMVSTQITLQ